MSLMQSPFLSKQDSTTTVIDRCGKSLSRKHSEWQKEEQTSGYRLNGAPGALHISFLHCLELLLSRFPVLDLEQFDTEESDTRRTERTREREKVSFFFWPSRLFVLGFPMCPCAGGHFPSSGAEEKKLNSKTRVAPPGMTPPAPLEPYPSSGGIVNLRCSPGHMSSKPWSHPLMT